MKQLVKAFLGRRMPEIAAALWQRRFKKRLVTGKAKEGFSLTSIPLILKPDWEREERQFFAQAIPNCDLFVDIGANVGFYTCMAGSAGKRVIAFEPMDHNLALLFENVRANSLRNVEIFPLALSSEPGVLDIYGASDYASLIQNGAAPTNRVAVNTLDRLVASVAGGQRLLLKMDVEGAEEHVLLGAHEVLRIVPSPVWLVEILKPETSTVFDTFRDVGYTCRRLGSEDCSIDNPGTLGGNFVFERN